VDARVAPAPAEAELAAELVREAEQARARGGVLGTSRGSGAMRSARSRISAQPVRGFSSFQAATGALVWPVHASSSSFAPPGCWRTRA